jgi:hypothetical protein
MILLTLLFVLLTLLLVLLNLLLVLLKVVFWRDNCLFTDDLMLISKSFYFY